MIQHLIVLLKWKNFLIINFLICTILAIVISFLLPQWYKSSTVLLPPKQPDILSSLSSGASSLKGLGSIGKLAGLGQKQSNYNYFAILKSRTVKEAVVRKFNLFSAYEITDSSMEKAIKSLESNVSFEDLEDDNIIIEVYDKDPLRASDMANYFVELLDDVNTRLGTQEARNNKEFIEERLKDVKTRLVLVEDSLSDYQKHSGFMLTTEQTTSVDAYASLYAMKAKKEIEAAVLQRNTTPDNENLRQLQMEISILSAKLATIPGMGLHSLRLYRDVVIQQKLLEFLVPLYEQARIDEQKNIPVLLVLDKAVPAERKSKPQRSLIVFLAAFFACTGSILLVFVMHGIIRSETDENVIIKKLKSIIYSIALFYRVPISK